MPLRAASIAIADRVLDVTSDVPERDWDEFVASRPEASGYHVWRWRRVFESAFGHETRYLAAHEDGRIVGVLPLVIIRSRLFGRCAVSLPFVNYGGVCAEDDEVAACLVRTAAVIASDRGLAHVELRHQNRQCPSLPERAHKVGMYLTLEREAGRAWDRLDKKVRNQVRKAEKSSLTARWGGRELLDRFYAVFAQNMRDLVSWRIHRAFFPRCWPRFPIPPASVWWITARPPSPARLRCAIATSSRCRGRRRCATIAACVRTT